jgi:adenylate kinase
MMRETMVEFEKIAEQPMLPSPHSAYAYLMSWVWWLSAAICTFLGFMLLCYSIWRLFDRPSWRQVKKKGTEVTHQIQEGVSNTITSEKMQAGKQKISELAETGKNKMSELAASLHGKTYEQMTPEERLKGMCVVAVIGPPGIGKGALSRHITPDFDIIHVSTGELIRKEIAMKTDIGLRVQAQVARGKLVPDEVVAALIEKKFKELAEAPEFHQGVLLDGFPRQLSQAELLESGRFNIPPLSAVISVSMPDEILDIRRSGRRICPECAATYNLHEVDQGAYHLRPRLPDKEGKCVNDGQELIARPDDDMSVATARMRDFHTLAPPMIEFYRKKGVLIEVEKQRQMKHIYKEIKPELERLVLTAHKSTGLPAAALAKAVDAFEFSKEKAGPALELAKEKAGQAAEFVKEKAGAGVALAKEKVVNLTDRTAASASKMKDISKDSGVEKDAEKFKPQVRDPTQFKDPFKDIQPITRKEQVKDAAGKHERFGANQTPEVQRARG